MKRLVQGLGILLLAAGVVTVGLALKSGGPRATTLPEPAAVISSTSETVRPEPTAAPATEPTPPSAAPIERITIPSIHVDAAIQVKGVDREGVMQDPTGPTDVAWYDFSGRPGFGSNAVFAGHVDYINYGPAVFWYLREVKLGDEIQVRLTDGTQYFYRIISVNSYSADDAPVQEIVGPTDTEVVTLITCGGTFNVRTREYDKRLIVRAERDRSKAGQAAN